MSEPHHEEKEQKPATQQRSLSPESGSPDMNRETGYQEAGNQPAPGYFLRQMNTIQSQPSPNGGAQT
jgi:hypothetical protein